MFKLFFYLICAIALIIIMGAAAYTLYDAYHILQRMS